jgi:hypothetical protein
VWKTAWEIDATLPLYGPDAFHPSELGTYAAAVTIYAVARHRSPVGLPFRLDVGGGGGVARQLASAHRSAGGRLVASATSEVTLRALSGHDFAGRATVVQPPHGRTPYTSEGLPRSVS